MSLDDEFKGPTATQATVVIVAIFVALSVAMIAFFSVSFSQSLAFSKELILEMEQK